MDQSLTLFTWFSGLVILIVIIMNILLALKFKRYFRSNGFGIVTLTLLSLVASHTVVSFIFGMTSLIVIVSGGGNIKFVYEMKDFGCFWIISSTLLHTMGITFQRVISISYGKKFLRIIRSKTNIIILISTKWFFTCVITGITFNSRSTATYSVFYLGFLLSGVLTIVNFLLTVEIKAFQQKIYKANASSNLCNLEDARIISKPRKTFTLFSGLVISFTVFCLPVSVPNLIYNLRGHHLSHSTSLVIALWLLLGVVFDCFWILMRLRSTVNDNTGFYSRWAIRKDNENVKILFKNNYEIGNKRKLLSESSFCPETDHEII